MKKSYTIAAFLSFLFFFSNAQIILNKFQVTVTDRPGAGTNSAIIKIRAVNDLVPQISTCNGFVITSDIVAGIKFAVKWPTSTGITDIAISTSHNAANECPDPGADPLAGYNMGGNSNPIRTSNDATLKVKPFLGATLLVPVPVDWVLNQWMTICTLNIVGGNCTVCEDLDIYMIGDCPECEIGLDLNHTMLYDEPGDNTAEEYDIAPNNAPLPLNLLAFTADKSGTQDALVSWTTSNEENTSHFKIQRSFDKKNWYDAGSIAAAGYSIDVKNYSFMDYKVYNGLDARLNVYYRLSMVDLDGRTKFSPMQTVVFGTDVSKGREFLVYPNPASDGLQVEWDANRDDQPTTLEFFDISGKLVYSQDVGKNTNQEYIDFGHTTIQPGLYLLRILNRDEPLDHKQIVVGRD